MSAATPGVDAVAAARPAYHRRLVARDARARRWLLLSVAAGAGATLALVGQLLAVAFAVAGVLMDGRTLDEVLPLLLAGLALLLARTLLAILGDLAAQRAAGQVVTRLRADLTSHLLRLGPTWTRRQRSGELDGVLMGGMADIDAYVSTFLPARWLALTVPLLILLFVLALDPLSVLVLLFTGPLLVLLLAVIGGRTSAITERRFLEMRLLSAFFLDILRGIATLKLFGRSREQVANLRRISEGYGDTTMEVLRTAFQTSLVLEWGATIAIALVAVEVGLRLLVDGIDFEQALAVLLITPEFFLPLRALAIRYHIGAAGRAAMARAFEILDEPSPGRSEVTPTADDGRAHPTRVPATGSGALVLAPRIVFEDVSFTWPGRAAPALDGVRLELPPGGTVALVGASGAGKSTLASLLLRFIDPSAGDISVDGRSLLALPRSTWRASVGWVPQNPHLFHGSVADNIRLARPGASDAAVRAAANAANADTFIDRLPRGFDTSVGEAGGRLSGGQRQRLAIARAFLRDAPVLVLDEATSHQDEAGEAAIADALDRLCLGRTVLLIAHRLRLAERADGIVVLEAGRVVEAGTPAELLAAAGPYRRLVEDHDGHGMGS